MVPISLRMKAIADMIPRGMSVADIGCDHGFVSIYLVTERGCEKAIAMDVNEGPLCRAKEHISQYCVEDKISVRLSDGAKKLELGEVDSAIIAGMGGKLTIRIIEDSFEKFRTMKCFVLSPHSDIAEVRKYLSEHGFIIVDEDMVFDEGKYYMIMKCVPGEAYILSEEEMQFGPKLIEKQHSVLKDYFCKEIDKYETIMTKINSNIVNASDEKKEALIDRMGNVDREIKKMQLLLNGFL